MIYKAAEIFPELGEDVLYWKPSANKWNIVEIFEHLNITHGIYIQYIVRNMNRAPLHNSDRFVPGWLGNLFYEKILPRPDGSIFKMKAPSFLHANNQSLNGAEVFKSYFDQLEATSKIIEKAQRINISKIRIPLSFTRLITIKLGDGLRFLVAHHERHLLQARKMKELYYATYGEKQI